MVKVNKFKEALASYIIALEEVPGKSRLLRTLSIEDPRRKKQARAVQEITLSSRDPNCQISNHLL